MKNQIYRPTLKSELPQREVCSCGCSQRKCAKCSVSATCRPLILFQLPQVSGAWENLKTNEG